METCRVVRERVKKMLNDLKGSLKRMDDYGEGRCLLTLCLSYFPSSVSSGFVYGWKIKPLYVHGWMDDFDFDFDLDARQGTG
jgi:hypothetical protein